MISADETDHYSKLLGRQDTVEQEGETLNVTGGLDLYSDLDSGWAIAHYSGWSNVYRHCSSFFSHTNH